MRRFGAMAIVVCWPGLLDAALAVLARPPTKPAPSAADLAAVSVIGIGETRQVQRIRPEDAQIEPPGTSPQKLLNRLPGVNVQSNDALGANEESQSISLRGFNTTRLGYTLDGLPLGDNAYGNWNGLNISRALIAENAGITELAEGIGGLGTASTSNLGGTIQYTSDDPSRIFGLRLDQGFGSNLGKRTFVRLDSGDYRGFSMYLSGVRSTGEQWGDSHLPSATKQFNGKVVYDFDGGRLSAFIDTSRTNQADNTYLSKSGLQRGLGWNWNLYAPDWQRAVNAARGVYSGGVDNADDAYYQSYALRRDNLYYLSGEVYPTEAVILHAMVYHHDNSGQGHWWTPHQASSPSVPISIRSSNYWIERTGAIVSAGWDIAHQHLETGWWYEDNHHRIECNFYAVDGPYRDDGYLTDPSLRVYNQRYVIITRQAYFEDRMKFFDERLSVDVGLKSPHTTMTAVEMPMPQASAPLASGRLDAGKALLPQAGLGYKLGGGHEVFLSYAENIAAFQGGGAGGPLAVSQAAWNQTRGHLKPEKSSTIEGGYRFRARRFQVVAAGYHVKFQNRLLSISPCPSIEEGTTLACQARFYNVGAVTSRGLELSLNWHPTTQLDWHNAVSYNRSTYDDDYRNDGLPVPTRGRYTTDTPKKLFSSELSWRRGAWRADLLAKYTGVRYYTYTNDQGFGGATAVDVALGYDFGAISPDFKDLSLAFNITNLTNKRMASHLSAFADSDPAGRRNAFHANAPRQFFGSVEIKL